MTNVILTDKGLYHEYIEGMIQMFMNESHSQIDKWGFQVYGIHKWNTIIHEEIGEIDKAILEFEHQRDKNMLRDLRTEIIQTITLYIKMYKMLDDFKHTEVFDLNGKNND